MGDGVVRYSGIPELLEQFMDENEADEQWITVHDLETGSTSRGTIVTRFPDSFAG